MTVKIDEFLTSLCRKMLPQSENNRKRLLKILRPNLSTRQELGRLVGKFYLLSTYSSALYRSLWQVSTLAIFRARRRMFLVLGHAGTEGLLRASSSRWRQRVRCPVFIAMVTEYTDGILRCRIDGAGD